MGDGFASCASALELARRVFSTRVLPRKSGARAGQAAVRSSSQGTLRARLQHRTGQRRTSTSTRLQTCSIGFCSRSTCCILCRLLPRPMIPLSDAMFLMQMVDGHLQLPEYAILTAPIRSEVESSICGFTVTQCIPVLKQTRFHPSFNESCSNDSPIDW